MPHHNHRTVNVYLTTAVLRALADDQEDMVIRFVDDCGGVFIERSSTVGNEGSGVWIDAVGNEHYDSSGEFEISEGAEKFMDDQHKAMADESPQGQRILQLEGEVAHWRGMAAAYYAQLKEHGVVESEPTDDELMGSRGENGTGGKPRQYTFTVTGTLNSTLSKSEIMEELYDQIKGRHSEHIVVVEVEKTKVRRDKR